MEDQVLARRASELIRREVDAGRIPFGAFGVFMGGECALDVFEGDADMERNARAAPDTIVRLYSMTKPVTAVAAMILCERGLLSERDPVSRFLPEYADARVLNGRGGTEPVRRAMTVADLLNMTAGLVYPGPDEAGAPVQAMFDELSGAVSRGEGWTARAVARRVARCPLAFQPGAEWRYGLEADVLGAVIEAASGRTLGAFFREELFEPLQMRDTGFFVPEEKRSRFAQLYRRENGRLAVDPERHIGLTKCLEPPAFESGGAGLVSTFRDYARFGRMLAGYGQVDGVRVLQAETVRRFEKDQLTDAQRATLAFAASDGYGYGHLMRVCADPAKTTARAESGEFGWDGWTGVYMAANARKNLFFLYLTQVSEGIDASLTDALRNLVYDWLEGRHRS